MSNWILYNELVDRVRNYHHKRFSGLITGVSNDSHSFQLGFERGEIVLLTYRIKKGLAALQMLTRIERARIAEQPNREFPRLGGEVPDTETILSQLTSSSLGKDSLVADLGELGNLSEPGPGKPARQVGQLPRLSAKQRQSIETAAIHYFGPIGAMVCAEHIDDPRGDVRKIMQDIAQEVGASEADTRAFFQSVSSD